MTHIIRLTAIQLAVLALRSPQPYQSTAHHTVRIRMRAEGPRLYVERPPDEPWRGKGKQRARSPR